MVTLPYKMNKLFLAWGEEAYAPSKESRQSSTLAILY